MTTILTRQIVSATLSPTARLTAAPDYAVIGAVISLDARASTDPNNLPLTYSFSFLSVPIGSKAPLEEFAQAVDEPGSASFSPDVVGTYVVQVDVSNGSTKATASVALDVRAILVPHAKGLVPDGKFIWSYLRDAWTQVDGRSFFETLWSALIQIAGGELLKLYQADYNKSIQDIQKLCQKRWLSYEPRLEISSGDTSVFLGNTMAGTGAATGPSGGTGRLIIRSATEVVLVQGAARPEMVGRDLNVTYSRSQDDVSNGPYEIVGLTSSRNGFRLAKAFSNPASNVVASGQAFEFPGPSVEVTPGGPLVWNIPGPYLGLDIRVGDAIVVESGSNAGVYSILEKTSTAVTVDRRPPKFSDGALCTVHRPIGFSIELDHSASSNTIVVELEGNELLAEAAPGRIIIVNGQAYTIARTSIERGQRVPVVVVTVDRSVVVSGLTGLSWRLPNTLVSKTQNFEELGVSTGDVLTVRLATGDGVSTTLGLQVVGADRNRIGFVLSDEPLEYGQVPAIPDSFYVKLSNDLGIPLVEEIVSGIAISDVASRMVQATKTSSFQGEHWNQEKLADFSVTLAGRTVLVRPLAIVRNSLVPIDEAVRSIPSLQERIVFPEVIERDGVLYETLEGTERVVTRRPVSVIEGSHYVVDTPAIETQLTFRTGTDVVDADSADFLDYGIGAGDVFTINSPLGLAGSYHIVSVLGRNRVRLDRPIPRYELGEYVSAKVTITRARSRHYIRFVPGLFSAKNQAPSRFWAEVTFFDNESAIENNFGMLVGLRRSDLEEAQSTIEYKQAVTGLMYAYTKGSSLSRLRLGSQILLGLPFSEHRGIIRAIDQSFRLDFDTGLPLYGRIMVEDVDDTDAPTGAFRFYYYPLNSESRLSGIETNPATNLPYVVGDLADEFVPLCKGVEVADYISKNAILPSVASILQKYHSVRVRADSAVLSPKEMVLVSSFLRRITPSYISFHLSMLAGVSDQETVSDDIGMLERTSPSNPPIVDNATMGMPGAFRFDRRPLSAPAPQFYDDGIFSVRRFGYDLDTTSGISTGGGLLNPKTGEIFEGPLCKVGDKLHILHGVNAGIYTISALTDSTITVSDGPEQGFVPLTDQSYAVSRAVTSLLYSGFLFHPNVEWGVQIQLNPHLRTLGVMPGDVVVTGLAGQGTRYVITGVYESYAGSGVWDRITTTPPVPTDPINTVACIYRPAFQLDVSSEIYNVTSDGSNVITEVTNGLMGFAELGDELLLYQQADQQRVTVIDPRNMYITPALPAGTHFTKLCKRKRASTPVPFDILDGWSVDEAVMLSLSGSGASIAANGTVTFSGAMPRVRPGDLFMATSGDNFSVDVGYGAGIFVVGSVGASSLSLTTTMTADVSATFRLVRQDFKSYAPMLTSGYAPPPAVSTTYLAVGTSGASVISSDALSWSSPTDYTLGTLMYSAEWDGSRFVAGGYNSAQTSPTGQNWTDLSTTIIAGIDIRKICIGGPAGYVVSGFSGYGAIATTPDFVNWTDRTTGVVASNYFNSIARNDSIYVAVGEYSGQIISSPNGADWTLRLFGSGSMKDVVWTGVVFVAVGDNSGEKILVTSPDGITWTPRTIAGDVTGAYGLRKVDFNGVAVLAFGWDGLARSLDGGLTWTFIATGGSVPSMLSASTAFGTLGFVASVATGGNIYTSSDNGDSWTLRQNVGFDVLDITSTESVAPMTITWSKVGVPFVEGQAYRTLADGTQLVSAIGAAVPAGEGFTVDQEQPIWRKAPGGSWTNVLTHPDWLQGEDIIQNPATGTVCIPMGSGQGYVFRSTNSGATWNQVAFDTVDSLRFIACDGVSTWVAVGDNGLMYVSTDDAATWTKVVGGANGNTYHFSAIFWDGSQFIGRAYDRLYTTTTPATSASWTLHTVPAWMDTKRTYATNGSIHVLLGRDPVIAFQARIYWATSVSGPWTQVAPAGQETQSPICVDFVDGHFVVALGSGFAHSPDGADWTYRQIDTNWNPISISKFGSTWVFMNEDWGYWWEGNGL